MLRSGGGGGFGDPRMRDAEKVAFDVREGYISRDKAESLYGVVVDRDSGEVDRMRTEKLRGTL
jgi:N-methylhydantoinase B